MTNGCFCHAMLCISTAYSVCMSCSCIVVEINLQNFSALSTNTILVFHTRRDGNIPTGTPTTGDCGGGGFEYRWDRKNSRFSTNIWLSNWWLVQCDQQYTVDAWCNRFRSHLAFVYRTERHLSVDLVYHSPCSMDDYAKENRAQFNCLHWWIWGRIN